MSGIKSAGELFSLAGKTAVVTGASSGLGRHFAGVLARAGARVALAARRVDRLETLASDLRASGADAHVVPLDVTNAASVVQAFDAAEAALGPISILINNAGVPSAAAFTKITEAEWRDVMAVNLDGVFRVGQEAARRMQRSGNGGAIVNIASIAAFAVMKTLAPYCVSKAGVIQMTKAMAIELARDGIRVNAIAPGYFKTEINATFWDTDAGKRMIQRMPFGRLGTYDELDGPLLLLASDAGRNMTGSVVTVDGGHLLAGI